MFGGLDPVKVLIVLMAAVVLLGPERLPRAARQLGGLWRELMTLRERLESEVRSAVPDLDLPKIPAIPTIRRGSVSSYITNMMQPGAATDAAATDAGAEAAAAATAGDAEAGSSLGSDRPGWQPAPENGSGQSGFPRAPWQTTAAADAEQVDVPAGWQAGADYPGYASGANFPSVPSSAPRGPLRAEALLTFDEPSWN